MRQLKLKTIDFISIFFRTFFIQAVWNFKSLVSVGLGFAMVPVARRLSRSQEEYSSLLKRHLTFFNTHPYFASFAIGALARLEEDRVKAETDNTSQIERFKNALIGPLGAIGDLYFWATLKPAAVLCGVAGVFYFQQLKYQLLSLLGMLVFYNIPHFHVRVVGLMKGYQKGYDIYSCLKVEKFSMVKNIYQIIGAVMLGITGVVAFSLHGGKDITAALVFIIAIGLAMLIRVKFKRTYLPILAPLVLALLIGML